MPDDQIENRISNQEIGLAISCFLQMESPDSRNVFLRKYWFCDSVKTIAEAYGFREEKVKSMLYRTRIRLKKHLQKEGITL